MSGLEWLWISLAVALCLLLGLGANLLVLQERMRRLEEQRDELAQRSDTLRKAQQDQSRVIAELHSALRAEKAHVEQLQRKNHLMALLPEQPPGPSGREP